MAIVSSQTLRLIGLAARVAHVSGRASNRGARSPAIDSNAHMRERSDITSIWLYQHNISEHTKCMALPLDLHNL
jgi:hypothetical protein